MTNALAAVSTLAPDCNDLLGDYQGFIDDLHLDSAQRSQRRHAARRFLGLHPDPAAWMSRPTNARLADLHRHKAWPLLTWLVVDGRLEVDLELLLAKPGGVDLGTWWSLAHPDDVARALAVAERLGWSPDWARQVIRHTAPVLCLWLGKTLGELTDADFDAAGEESERLNVRSSTRDRFAGRCLALRQLCFQDGTVDHPPRDPRPAARPPAEHAATIAQPDIRRDVMRYAEVITTTLRPSTGDGRPTDFVFTQRGRRIGAHRLRVCLLDVVASADLRDRAGNPLHVTLHQLRHTFGTTLANAGMSLPALMALLGHVTPEMTLRYARLASPTIRDAYDTAMAKVNGRRLLFTIPAGTSRAIPAKIDWLHTEMLKTRVAHGFCSRDPVAGACPYANICEQCDNFVPDPASAHVLAEQLDDVVDLRDDATSRGWTDEAARHERVATSLETHLRRLERDHPTG